MACIGYSRASGNSEYEVIGLSMFDNVIQLRKNQLLLGRPVLSGQTPTSQLNIPMILLNVIYEIRGEDKNRIDMYKEESEWCLHQIMLHVNKEKKSGT